MAQLVDLVVGNHLDAENVGEILDVCLAGSHAADAAAGKGNLGSGSELIDHVGPTGLSAQGDNVGEGDIVAFKLMDAVSIVPDNGKVRSSRLQIGKALNGLLGENNAVRIGVLGHRPDHLDLGIFYIFLHQIHIRAGGGHGDGNQLRTVELANLEMPVIARSGAEELDFLLFAPGTGAVQQTMAECTGHHIKHHIQGCGAAYEHFRRLAAQYIGPVGPGAGNTCQLTIVPGVNTVVDTIFRCLQHGQNAADHVQLRLGGLAAGHVQVQSLGLTMLKICQNTLVFTFQFFSGHARVGGHIHHPSWDFLYFLGLLYACRRKNAISYCRKFHF